VGYTNLKDVKYAVARREVFQGNNVFGSWQNLEDEALYVVFSYGEHWPLAAYIPRLSLWFRNDEKNSVTTGRHRSSLGLTHYVPVDLAGMRFVTRTLLRDDKMDNEIGSDLRAAAAAARLLGKVNKARGE
jgi:hypothetical protein